VRDLYGLEPEVLHLPPGLDRPGPATPLPGVAPGFVLCVSRLLAYKNVEPLVRAFHELPGERLVLAGEGPLLGALRRSAPANVVLPGRVTDDELRWLYASCRALVAPSYEDYGLTPIEAGGYGKPTAALRFGGYLDTIAEGETGLFFEQPLPAEIAAALRSVIRRRWDAGAIARRADGFSHRAFVERMYAVVDEELALSATARRQRPGA
jgi:glycosyltransferase involved in cell wall biosynthesis